MPGADPPAVAAGIRISHPDRVIYPELRFSKLQLAEGRSVMLEEYARELIFEEEFDAGEVDKMLRRPGEIASVSG